MLKRFRIVGLCLVAVFALSVVAASSASAYPGWQESTTCEAAAAGYWEEANGNECKGFDPTKTSGFELGGWTELTTTKASASSGTLTLTTSLATIKCDGTDGGTIGPGSEDEITKITTTKCSGCTIEPSAAKALNLPWKTKLYNADATKIRDDITGHDSTKEPGWEGSCAGIIKQKCFANTSAAITNKPDGTVDATFDALSTKGKCEGGGEGTVTGTDTIETTKEVTKKGIRATKN
jgi:hypothetical protein